MSSLHPGCCRYSCCYMDWIDSKGLFFFLYHLPYVSNRPRSINQYFNMTPRLSGQNCKIFKLLLSLSSQKRLRYKENSTKYRSLTWKPQSHVRILIHRTWPIELHVTLYKASSCSLHWPLSGLGSSKCHNVRTSYNPLTLAFYSPILTCVNAAKYEIQKPSTCRETLFRCKFLSMFPVFHLARSNCPATKTFVADWRKVLRKVERWSTWATNFGFVARF